MYWVQLLIGLVSCLCIVVSNLRNACWVKFSDNVSIKLESNEKYSIHLKFSPNWVLSKNFDWKATRTGQTVYVLINYGKFNVSKENPVQKPSSCKRQFTYFGLPFRISHAVSSPLRLTSLFLHSRHFLVPISSVVGMNADCELRIHSQHSVRLTLLLHWSKESVSFHSTAATFYSREFFAPSVCWRARVYDTHIHMKRVLLHTFGISNRQQERELQSLINRRFRIYSLIVTKSKLLTAWQLGVQGKFISGRNRKSMWQKK